LGKCVKCGNEYDKSFEIKTKNGNTYVFDSFECAINELAPRCKHCGCTVIGHGMEDDGVIFCCAHCAHEEGETEFIDRT
jgi:Rieske Fe-S protein